MKRFIVILIIAWLTSPVVGEAQKFYVDNGRFIIDCSPATGFPDGAVTAVPKYVGSEYDSPSTTAYLHAENRFSGEINRQVYQTFEIAPYNLDSDGSFNTDNTPVDARLNWVYAYNACRNSNYDGGGWRLPTYREMLLVGIFLEALQSELVAGGYPRLYDPGETYRYWTATESNTSLTGAAAWIMDGLAIGWSTKTSSLLARCIREVR